MRDKADLARHFIYRLGQQFKKYSEQGLSVARDDMKHAKGVFDNLKKHSDLLVRKAVSYEFKPSTSTFLETWLDIFR